MWKTEKGYKIRTNNNTIKEFIIGENYSAFGNCGLGKDIKVIGKLSYDDDYKQFILTDEKGLLFSINEKTLKILNN